MGIALLVVLAALAACARPTPLSNTFESPEALATEVLRAFREGDRERLAALAVTEEEFRTHVWPELPVAEPERNFPFSFVWGQLARSSALYLAQLETTLDGHEYELVSVVFAGESTPYTDVTVRRETELVVRTPDGEEMTVRAFGSTIEQGGRYKVFSYVVD